MLRLSYMQLCICESMAAGHGPASGSTIKRVLEKHHWPTEGLKKCLVGSELLTVKFYEN